MSVDDDEFEEFVFEVNRLESPYENVERVRRGYTAPRTYDVKTNARLMVRYLLRVSPKCKQCELWLDLTEAPPTKTRSDRYVETL